jgi:hypothetical protein
MIKRSYATRKQDFSGMVLDHGRAEPGFGDLVCATVAIYLSNGFCADA